MQFIRFALWAWVCGVAAPVAQAIKMEEIPALVKRQNRDVQIAEQDQEAARQSSKASYARYFPTIDLKSTYTRLNDDLVIDIEAKRIERDILGGALTVGIEVDPPPIKVQDKNIYNSHLLLTQPLYTGGRIGAGTAAAGAQYDEAKLNTQGVSENKTQEALVRYFQINLATQSIGVLLDIEKNLKRLEEVANTLVKSGMAAKFSTLQIQVAQAELRAKLEDAQNKERLAILAFQTTTGMDASKPVVVESPLRQLALKLGLDRFKIQALQKRREFSILKSKESQVQALKDSETGKMLPTVYAFGKRELLPDQLTQLQPLWAVGVGVDIPLTAGLSQFPERFRAAELAQKVESTRQKAMHEIPLQVESLYAGCQANERALLALGEGQSMANEALRLAEIRLKAGQGSSVEVLKASTDVETMQIKRLLLLEEYNRRLIELYVAAGGLDDYFEAYRSTGA